MCFRLPDSGMKDRARLPRIWSPEARQDLLDIWAYVADHGSAAIADKQLKEIERACFVLEAWSQFGKTRDDVRAGLHSVSVSRYVVFYRVTKVAVEIVRVLDERRDVDAILDGD
jgi:toxin ParE1/3/4